MHQGPIRHLASLLAVTVAVAGIGLWAPNANQALARSGFHSRLGRPATLSKLQSPVTVAHEVTSAPKRLAPYTPAAKGFSSRRAVSTRAAAPRLSGSELSQARALLAAQIRLHPILRGTTIRFGNTYGYQAISYYKSGEIILSTSHRASLSRIIGHEVWHVIDWRDNHRIDWGENVPR
jgi:hypothetical protein